MQIFNKIHKANTLFLQFVTGHFGLHSGTSPYLNQNNMLIKTNIFRESRTSQIAQPLEVLVLVMKVIGVVDDIQPILT
jgi:hypothetical protein